MNSFQQIKQFNRFAGENVSLIKKALSSATGVGEALIPQSLEKEISNLIIRLSPELALLQPKKIQGKYHEFNQLTALPAAGGIMGENATTPTTNSTTVRTGVTLKIIRRKGAVTNFLQDSSGEYIDAAAYEMENHLIAHVYDLVNICLYGNVDSNTYEFSGLDKLIGATYNSASATVCLNRIIEARYGVTKTTLKFLDDMIDRSNRKGGSKHRRCFVMSPEMLSFVSQLLTNVRLNQGLAGTMSQVEINGGWRLNAYRDIPIVESTSTRPITTMTTITPATAGVGGTIPDATTYYFKVAPITLNGEELAAATSQLTAAATSTITLSWTANVANMRYKIYCSTTQNSEVLVTEIPGFMYDANGTISNTLGVNSVTFTTAPDSANPTGTYTDGTTSAALPTASVSTWMTRDLAYEQEALHDVPETIFLWDLDPIQGLGKLPYTNQGGSNFDGLITTTPLAQTDDFLPFLIKSYTALTPSCDWTSVMHRGVRTY